jgi:hypothetical protein
MTITLKDVGSGFKRTAINENFDTIESELNNNVLRRDSVTGANQMEVDIDMNSQRLLNLVDAINGKEPVTLDQLNGALSAASSGLIAAQQEQQTGAQVAAGVTTFTGITYTVSSNNLYVFRNGTYQTKGVDYNETSTSSITWLITPNSGDSLVFITNLATTNSTTNTSAITHTDSGTEYNLASYIQNRHTISVKDFGAVGDGVTDDSVAIQAAINAASAGLYRLKVPTGTYILSKGSAVLWDSVDGVTDNITAYPCLILKSNLHIDADEGAVFKVADNQSSDGTPIDVPLMCSFEQLSNITVRGLTFDSNQANNSINTIAKPWVQFGFLGAITSSSMAYGNDIVIEGCKFINNPGVTNIAMSSSEITSGILGKRWLVKGNYFYNNGYKSYDHSSIYGYAEDVVIDSNTFDNPDMFGDTQIGGTNVGGQVAYEIHGANTRFTNNKVKNYAQALWLSSNRVTDVDNIIIDNNTFSPILERAIATYRQSAGEAIIKKVVISNNTCGLNDGASAQFKSFVDLSPNYPITDVLVTGNIGSKVGTTTNSAFVAIGAQNVAGQKQDNIKVVGNQAGGFCFGVYMTTTATNGLGAITINDNDWLDLDDTAAFPTISGIAANIVGTNTIDYLSISGNTCKDSAGVCDYGININAGTVTHLHVSGNSAFNMAVSDYIEGATVTNRSGEFANIPFTPTLVGWTNVGAPNFTGSQWSMSGKIVTCSIAIQAGTSISSTLLTSTITNLPYNPVTPVIASCAEINNGAAQDNCVVTAGGTVYPPTTGVLTGQLGITFTYSI